MGQDKRRTILPARGLAAVFALAMLSACSTTGGFKPMAFAPAMAKPAGTDAAASPLLTALNGGILPPDSRTGLSRSDQLRALEAEYSALERAPAGQAVAWTGTSGASGTVMPAAPYQVGQQNCRQYSHTAVIAGQQVSGQGAACRNEDGSWTPLT